MEHAEVPSMDREQMLETWVHTYARAILKTCFIYLPIMILHKTRCKIRL